MKALLRINSLFLACTLLFGCTHYKPGVIEDSSFLERVSTQTKGNLTVSVAGLSEKEGTKIFGVNLAKKRILPIWIKIENRDPKVSYFFLQRSIDSNYFTSGEAAYMSRIKPGTRLTEQILPSFLTFTGLLLAPFDYFVVRPSNERMEQEFEEHAFKDGWIKPQITRSGFVFVGFELGTKQVNIDLYGDDRNTGENKQDFDFFVQVPGMKVDHNRRDFETLYSAEKMVNLTDEKELAQKLEALPCCTTNKKDVKDGDPMNLIIIGTLEEVLAAFTAAKWDETEIVYLSSIWKTISSFSFKKKYRYSPVSPLYFEGRSQDIAFQKARDTIHERMHLRLWFTPMQFQSKPVWVGSVSRDIGVRFTLQTWNLMTHKIDPDIDESRLYVMADLIYSFRIQNHGFVMGITPSNTVNPAKNLTLDPYFTDGRRVVLMVSDVKMETFPPEFDW